MMSNLLMVALGGGAGATMRYLASGWIQQWLGGSSTFPVGTFVVNVTGCLLIGFLSQIAESLGLFTPQTRALVFTGFLGGYTTYSTFANESFSLVRDGAWNASLLFMAGHIVLGLAAVWAGRTVALLIWG